MAQELIVDPTLPSTDGDEEETFISTEDILAEVPDDGDGDVEMDDDDDDEPSDLPSSSNSVQSFSGHHPASVFTLALHPSLPLAVSGGEDDTAYVWDLTDGEIYLKMDGHSDSVGAVGWSADGGYVASGGMDGLVRVWRKKQDEGKEWEFVAQLDGPDEVTFLRWHPKGNVLMAGSNDFTVWLWQIPSTAPLTVLSSHTSSVTCGLFTPDGGKRILTSSSGSELCFWDPRVGTPVWKLSSTSDGRFDFGSPDSTEEDDDEEGAAGAGGGITSIAINPTSTLAVVGGSNGTILIISLSKGEILSALSGGHTPGESIEAICFLDIGAGGTAGVVATGATDGKICIWDLNTMRLRATLKHDDAITTLLSPKSKGYLLVSASADKTLKTWDARTGQVVKEHRGHQGPVLGASLGLDGTVVASAGDDGHCLVFEVEPVDKDGVMK